MNWKILHSLTHEKINQILLKKIDYLIEENKVLRSQVSGRLKLNDAQRLTLSKLANKLGKKYFSDICNIYKPKTVLDWYRKILARSHTYPKLVKPLGRPSTLPEIERKLIQIASENRLWGCGKLKGALKNLNHDVSEPTIRRILKKHNLKPIKNKKHLSSWHQFIKANKDVLWATDFFSIDILSPLKVKTFYVLFFIHIATRKVYVAGITQNPNKTFMRQVSRNLTMTDEGFLKKEHYLIHDGDGKFIKTGFIDVLKEEGIQCIQTSHRSPDLNSFAERWVRSIKEECLNHLMLFSARSLRYAVKQYVEFYNSERNHQSLNNDLLNKKLNKKIKTHTGAMTKKQRLGGLLNFYYRKAS